MQYKLRSIVKSDKVVKYGITIPNEIASFFSGCLFNPEISGTCIVLYSGCSLEPTKEEVQKYEFEDCRI